MRKLTSPLDHVKISSPCSANWDQMFSFEDKRVRFCSQCNLNVYNLSGMSRSEAEALITKTEGRLCVRFYRKSDGSILTQNCPLGMKAIKRRVLWMTQFLFGILLSFVSGLSVYIFYLGKYPLSFPGNPLKVTPHPVLMGALKTPIREFPPKPPINEFGEVIMESGQNGKVLNSKANGRSRNQRFRRGE